MGGLTHIYTEYNDDIWNKPWTGILVSKTPAVWVRSSGWLSPLTPPTGQKAPGRRDLQLGAFGWSRSIELKQQRSGASCARLNPKGPVSPGWGTVSWEVSLPPTGLLHNERKYERVFGQDVFSSFLSFAKVCCCTVVLHPPPITCDGVEFPGNMCSFMG